MTTAAIVLASVRLWGGGGAPVDVVLKEGRVSAVVPAKHAVASVDIPADAERIDLDGRWLMPGLTDRHVHFTLWAKQRARLSVAGLASAADAAAAIRTGLTSAPGQDIFIARGYQDALWPDVPTAALLDDAAAAVGQAGRAIVVISHDLHSVWINTAAAARYGAPAGFLTERAAIDLEIAVEREEKANPARVEAQVREAALAAAARGVTGIMDLEMADNPAVWAARFADGLATLRVSAGVYPEHWEAALARGERSGTVVDGSDGMLTVGPLKVFADGSLNTRTAWCFDPYPDGGHGEPAHQKGGLEALLGRARDNGYEVALHAIGDRAVAAALDAFAATGARGSIEHAQLMRPEDAVRCTALGIAAGIHPEHAMDDRPVTDALWAGRTGRAFPYGTLQRAGVELRMGSDAPVSPLDPWLGISAAVHRTRDAQEPWEAANALTLEQALAASWAMPNIVPGVQADVVVLDGDPRSTESAAELRAMPVTLTVAGGAVTHRLV